MPFERASLRFPEAFVPPAFVLKCHETSPETRLLPGRRWSKRPPPRPARFHPSVHTLSRNGGSDPSHPVGFEFSLALRRDPSGVQSPLLDVRQARQGRKRRTSA